jgi:hypothetical protein
MSKSRIETILKDSNYQLSLFSSKDIKAIEDRIIEKNKKLYVNCIIGKEKFSCG